MQSEEQLSEAFSELTSREGQLEPVLQPTKAMLAAQAKAFAKGTGEKEELVDHKHSGVIITRKDIRTLTSRAWLNDEVMNVYMGLLQVCAVCTAVLTDTYVSSACVMCCCQQDSRVV